MVAEKCKPCEIYRRICDDYGEAHFSQKMFTNGLNMGLSQLTSVKNTVSPCSGNTMIHQLRKSSGHRS